MEREEKSMSRCGWRGWELPWEQRNRADAEQGTPPSPGRCPRPRCCFRDVVLKLHVQPLEVITRSCNLVVLVRIQPCPNCWAVGTPPWAHATVALSIGWVLSTSDGGRSGLSSSVDLTPDGCPGMLTSSAGD